MDLLERLASGIGISVGELRLVLTHYAWLVGPALLGLGLVTIGLIKALPRQRRREDLSGQGRRVR